MLSYKLLIYYFIIFIVVIKLKNEAWLQNIIQICYSLKAAWLKYNIKMQELKKILQKLLTKVFLYAIISLSK